MRFLVFLALSLALCSHIVSAQDTSATDAPVEIVSPSPTITAQPAQPSQTPQAAQPTPAANAATSPPATAQQPPAAAPNATNTTAPAAVTAPPPPPTSRNIVDYVNSNDVFSVLMSLVEFTNLTETIRGLKGVTLFAPTNAAFFATLRDFRYKNDGDAEQVTKVWIRLLQNSTDLIDPVRLLKYHLTPKVYTRAALANLPRTADKKFVSLNADDYITWQPPKGLKDAFGKLPNPTFTMPDAYSATNGIVHALDRVLFYQDYDRSALNARVQDVAAAIQREERPCFPLSASVHLANGNMLSLGGVHAGHHIAVDELGTTSRIFLFTHRRRTGIYPFLRLHTASGHAITLSGTHYLYADGRLTAARSVLQGAMLRTASGPSRVVRIESVYERGLVAPHTLHGDVMVDGIVASCYTTAVHPRVADVMLAPLRALVRLGVAREPLGAMFYDGADRIAKLMPRGPDAYDS